METNARHQTWEVKVNSLTMPVQATLADALPGGAPIVTVHKFRKPTREEFYIREQKIHASQTQLSRTVIKRDPINLEAANAWLYDQIAEGYAEYRPATRAEKFTGQFSHLTEEQLAELPAGIKSSAIENIWKSRAIVEGTTGDDDGFVMLSSRRQWIVRLEIQEDEVQQPRYLVRLYFKPPTQRQLEIYRTASFDEIVSLQGKRAKTTITAQLKPAVDLFCELLIKAEGFTYEGRAWSEEDRENFLTEIEPPLMREAVQALINVFEGTISD
jgi:hypothetical protein